MGSPGVIDARKGMVSSARNLPDWEGSFPLGKALKDALGPAVKIDNDVNVATDAEFELGAGQPYRSLLGVFWGTGVGGGIVLRGKPWLGRGAAGEIGHVCVVIDGARCPCGRRGCVEAYAGRGAGGAGPAPAREGPQDRPVQDHGEARPRPAHERDLGARARARTTSSPRS